MGQDLENTLSSHLCPDLPYMTVMAPQVQNLPQPMSVPTCFSSSLDILQPWRPREVCPPRGQLGASPISALTESPLLLLCLISICFIRPVLSGCPLGQPDERRFEKHEVIQHGGLCELQHEVSGAHFSNLLLQDTKADKLAILFNKMNTLTKQKEKPSVIYMTLHQPSTTKAHGQKCMGSSPGSSRECLHPISRASYFITGNVR